MDATIQWQIMGGTTWTVTLHADFPICSWSEQRCAPLAPLSSWVSSRPSPSVPRPPGGKSLKWKLCSWFPFNYPVLDREHAGKCCLSYVYDWKFEQQKLHRQKTRFGHTFSFIMTKSGLVICSIDIILWCLMFCGHNLGQWLHGFYPIQAQTEAQKLSQEQSLLHILSWVRATKTVLLVVSTFVCFNTLFSINYIVLSVLKDPGCSLWTSQPIITACFQLSAPFCSWVLTQNI